MTRRPLPAPSVRPLALAACALALALACDRAPRESGVPAATASEAAADDRLAHLFGPCLRAEPFTADTTDLLSVQVRKLATAEAHVAARARADLIAAGRAALPELARAFRRTYSEPGTAPRLLVLLDLAGLAGGPEARVLGLEGLEHPSESVGTAAARVLQAAGEPADYERLLAGVRRGSEEHAAQCALALTACDPLRVARELPGWLTEPRLARVVDAVVPRVALQLDAAAREALLADPRATRLTRTWVLGAAARAGDSAARTELLGLLEHENSMQRQVALQAALASGLALSAAQRAARDPDPALRVLAFEALAREPDAPERRAELVAGLADGDESVRKVTLTALCARGDPGALAVAIEMLSGTADDVGSAMSALRVPLGRDEQLADTVRARLEQLLEGGARSTGRALERAIGLVPQARAAEVLLERGRAGGAPIQGLSAHRWHAVQAANTGAAGRAWIRAQWESEADPQRRLDLISAGAQGTAPEVVTFLARVLESPRASDTERLLAGDLLARAVPAAQAAPILKQAQPAFTDPALRRAYLCLLWRFYGPEPG
ncbi:MAG: hypothetical protein JNK02_15595 [Planctomycetes bacterium]|nr:hypothetical protein [Planctomycetota bacterium]